MRIYLSYTPWARQAVSFKFSRQSLNFICAMKLIAVLVISCLLAEVYAITCDVTKYPGTISPTCTSKSEPYCVETVAGI
jgi:cytochrome c oxidase assembly protein Cox11